MAAGIGQFLLYVTIKLGVGSTGCIIGIEQARIGIDAPHQFFELFEFFDSIGEVAALCFGNLGFQLAFPFCLKGNGLLRRDFKVTCELRAVRCRVKIGEVPAWQIAQIR